MTEEISSDSAELAAFADLTPDQMLDAVEAVGVRSDCRMLALNSYENRVYRIGVVDDEPVVSKFYRPHRWTDQAIIEEHRFTQELADAELPVIAPNADALGITLHHDGAHRFALYPCRGGRPPELDDPDHLQQLGRFVGRMHAIGSTVPFEHRETLSIDSMAVEPRRFLLANDFIPDYLIEAYSTLTTDLIGQVETCYQRAGSVRQIRLHGDLHPGNVLWTEQGPHIVDFDDARMGPAIQDLWMFLSGDRAYMTARLADLLDGYTLFSEFDPAELHLLEALRTLRMIHYAGWLARRWTDPAFPLAFPWFNTPRYWVEHIDSLREQAALLNEPPLIWD